MNLSVFSNLVSGVHNALSDSELQESDWHFSTFSDYNATGSTFGHEDDSQIRAGAEAFDRSYTEFGAMPDAETSYYYNEAMKMNDASMFEQMKPKLEELYRGNAIESSYPIFNALSLGIGMRSLRAIFGVGAVRGRTTLYRAVSKAELDDIAVNGIRNAPGYETGKLFATSAQDASNFGRLNFGLDQQPFTIIKTSISNKFAPMLYRGEMDLMRGVSVPNSLFNRLSSPNILNYTPIPKHPWIR